MLGRFPRAFSVRLSSTMAAALVVVVLALQVISTAGGYLTQVDDAATPTLVRREETPRVSDVEAEVNSRGTVTSRADGGRSHHSHGRHARELAQREKANRALSEAEEDVSLTERGSAAEDRPLSEAEAKFRFGVEGDDAADGAPAGFGEGEAALLDAADSSDGPGEDDAVEGESEDPTDGGSDSPEDDNGATEEATEAIQEQDEEESAPRQKKKSSGKHKEHKRTHPHEKRRKHQKVAEEEEPSTLLEMSVGNGRGKRARGEDPQDEKKDDIFQLWCGGHWAENCNACTADYGRLWCNGDCEWERGLCTFRQNLTWCGGHAADSCTDCAWEDRGTQGRMLIGRAWCHGDCYWHEGNNACHSVYNQVRPKECSGWSPESGEFKGWGAKCGLWGWHREWCYVDKNYNGYGKDLMEASAQYPEQYFAPCLAVSFEEIGYGECLDAYGMNYDHWTGQVGEYDMCKETCTSRSECVGFEWVQVSGECSTKFADNTLPSEAVGELTDGYDGNYGVGEITGKSAPEGSRQCFKKVREAPALTPAGTGMNPDDAETSTLPPGYDAHERVSTTMKAPAAEIAGGRDMGNMPGTPGHKSNAHPSNAHPSNKASDKGGTRDTSKTTASVMKSSHVVRNSSYASDQAKNSTPSLEGGESVTEPEAFEGEQSQARGGASARVDNPNAPGYTGAESQASGSGTSSVTAGHQNTVTGNGDQNSNPAAGNGNGANGHGPGKGIENVTRLQDILEYHLAAGDWRGEDNIEHNFFVVIGISMVLFCVSSAVLCLFLSCLQRLCGVKEAKDEDPNAEEGGDAEGNDAAEGATGENNAPAPPGATAATPLLAAASPAPAAPAPAAAAPDPSPAAAAPAPAAGQEEVSF